MSLEIIRRTLANAAAVTNWKIYACKHKEKSNSMEYTCCNINFKNNSDLLNLVVSISYNFNSNKISKKQSVRDYSGFNDETVVSKINIDDDLISENYNKIIQSIACSSDETDINDFDSNSFIINGSYKDSDGNDVSVIMITLRAPFRKFKRAFSLHDNAFKPYSGKLLQIAEYFDIMIIDKTLYLFSFAGESILNLERSYKAKCRDDVDTICEMDIVSDKEEFSKIANSTHNPRKFITFQQSKLDYLVHEESRIIVSNKFEIPLNTEKKFDVSESVYAERLIKFLCNKAKMDPVDNSACEVSVSIPWS